MGLIYKTYLEGEKIFACNECNSHLSTKDDIVSRAFQGQHGRAYLFNTVVNIFEGHNQDRQMTTGLHTVRDIFCNHCNRVLGWRYVKAYEAEQKYKEGKYILEKALMVELS
jgi:hypothetical protein